MGLRRRKIVIKLKQILFMIHLKTLDQAHAVAILTEWDEFKTTIGMRSIQDVQTGICI
jgi:hypothetical protein